MTAPEALRAAWSAGVKIGLDGDDLVLEASAPPPAAVLDALSRHKSGVVALLRPANGGLHGELVPIPGHNYVRVHAYRIGISRGR